MSTTTAKPHPGPLSVGADGRVRNDPRNQDPNRWADTFVSFSGNFGSYGPHLFAEAPAMLALLRETLKPGAYGTGSTLAQRIDALVRRLDEQQGAA